MVRIRLEDFTKWYGSNTLHDLYHKCIVVAKYDPAGQANRAVTIDESAIKGEAFVRQFREWVASHPDAILPVAQSYPELDALQPQDAPLQPEPKTAPEQRRADIEATQERYLKHWVAQQGLLNTTENGNLIDKWMSTHETSYTPQGLDRAIEANRNALAWYAPPTTEFIPGTKEVRLPLGTRPSSKHSVNQLRDLHHREQAEKSARIREENTKLVKSVR